MYLFAQSLSFYVFLCTVVCFITLFSLFLLTVSVCMFTLFGPRREKTCLRGYRNKRDSNQSLQLQRLARIVKFHLKQVKIWNFPVIKRIIKALISLRRLVWAFVVRNPPRQVLSRWGPFNRTQVMRNLLLFYAWVKVQNSKILSFPNSKLKTCEMPTK